MFNAAIVGFGAWGRRLVASVQGKSERIRFTAGVTRTPARVQAFADSHGIRLGSDLGAAFSDRAVDGVVVVGPAGLHAEHAMAAIDAGKHVLVIKPFALRRMDAEAMRAAAAARGVLVALGYDRCFSPAMSELRRRVRPAISAGSSMPKAISASTAIWAWRRRTGRRMSTRRSRAASPITCSTQ